MFSTPFSRTLRDTHAPQERNRRPAQASKEEGSGVSLKSRFFCKSEMNLPP